MTVTSNPGPAYRYRDADLNVIHTTSAPKDDTQALNYFGLVSDWFKNLRVVFIEKRDVGSTEYHFMQYEFDGKEARPL